MKQVYTLLFLVLLSSAAFSQITITSADLPSSGDTLRYTTTNSRPNFTNTGANYHWNFATLTANGQGVDNYKSVLAINPLYLLTFGLTDFGLLQTASLNLIVVTLTDIYLFFKKTTSTLTTDGIGVSYTSFPLGTRFTVPDKVYQFPLTYGRNDTSTYDYTISIPTIASLHVTGTRYNTVDGWGTITTLYGTHNCLRIKMTLKEVDSIKINALGNTALGIPNNSTTYQWLGNGSKTPLLEVKGNDVLGAFIVNQVHFRDSVRFIPPQFRIQANFVADKVNCNVGDTVRFTNQTRRNVAGSTYVYSIMPNNFFFLSGTSYGSANPVVQFNAPGLYTISLYVQSPAGGSVPATSDTTKVDYIRVNRPLGIADPLTEGIFTVYPNPVTDNLFCTLKGEGNNFLTLELFDLNGSLVYNAKAVDNSTVQIPCTTLAAGIYFLHGYNAEGNSFTRKVIKE